MGALIELKNIGYSYHNLAGETDAIKDVSFQVEEGEFVALVGASGCGKSTLLSIIAGLLAPETGTIVVNNPDGSLHYPRVGYMLQHDHLFEWRTIYQNVTLGLEIHHALTKERTDYVKQLLSDYGLESFQDKRPSELSGGMKQRAALIRTLILKPDLLLLDEPTKGLDSFFKRQLAGLLRRLMTEEGVTIVMVSHDVEFCAEYADSVSMFFDGQLLTTNTPRRFFAQNSFYTTAANRMSRHLFPQAVTAEDVVTLMKENQLT